MKKDIFYHPYFMKIICFTILLLNSLSNFSCRTNKILKNTNNSIEINKTEIETGLSFLGKPDDEFGRCTKRTNGVCDATWYMYKKSGISLYTKVCYPEDENKKVYIKQIEIFDTTGISNFKNINSRKYYNHEADEVTKEALKKNFGNPNKIIKYKDQKGFVYTSRNLIFVFENESGAFVKIICPKK